MNEVQRRTGWMLLFILALAFAACATLAANAAPRPLQIRNIASGSGVLAADCVAVVEGEGFTDGEGIAGSYTDPPASLAGVRVLIGGEPARLRYLSARQIQVIVPAVDWGWQRVEVCRKDGAIWGGWATIASASPGLFTEFGSAQGIVWDGYWPRILCTPELKVNCQLPANVGETGVQLWGTGWRNARHVWVLLGDRWIAATVSRGNLIAPGNHTLTFMLPAGVCGKLRVRVWADGRISNEASLWIAGGE